MKYQYQIVGAQQFEYVMGEIETNDPKVAVDEYYALKKAYYVGGGIPNNDFNAVYDKLRTEKKLVGDPGIISQMSMAQQFALNELKKSIKREPVTNK